MERLQRELFEAAEKGNVSSLHHLLIEDSILLDRVTPNYNSDTALHVSALLGHLDFVKEIIAIKPELTNKLNSQRSSPLHLASAKGHVDVVRELLSVVSHETPCLAQDKDGLTPLHLAAVEGQVAVMELLLQAKPEAARLTLYGGETILHLCVKNWQVEALKLLVSSVNDPEFVKCRDGEGNTLLHLAVEYKQVEGFICVHSVARGTAAERAGLGQLYEEANRSRHLLVISRLQGKSLMPSTVDSDGLIHCCDNGDIRQELFLAMEKADSVRLHLMSWPNGTVAASPVSAAAVLRPPENF